MDFAWTPEQESLRARVKRFVEGEVKPRARRADETATFPVELVTRLAEEGWLAGAVSPEWGGSGMDHVTHSILFEELGRGDASVRGFLSVHGGLVALCLQDHGSAAQKSLWLPQLASGAAIGCYALTEPNAGSDAAAIETTAQREGDDYYLNGTKVWVTNGGIADVAIVFAKDLTVVADKPHHRITAFLVPTRTPGLERVQPAEQTLGHRAADHVTLRFADCRVPTSTVLGTPGSGFKIAMAGLDYGRLTVAAGAVGLGLACLDEAVAFANTRRVFGQSLGDFQMIQAGLADTAVELEAARLLVLHGAWLKDRGLSATQATSMAKLYATEAALRAADNAVLVLGGHGYDNRSPVERHWRDAKGMQIYEGTSHIQRIVIARSLLKAARAASG